MHKKRHSSEKSIPSTSDGATFPFPQKKGGAPNDKEASSFSLKPILPVSYSWTSDRRLIDTVPVLPSIVTMSPVCISFITLLTFTTEGKAYSRATTMP